ncbi:MAG TPA: hypothetical protein VFU76_05210 [Terriglobales bacterium]|nr:hypothetical protein [Terriglobales bacterium]
MAEATEARPLAVTIVSLVLIASGFAGIYSHRHHVMSAPTPENVAIVIVGALAIVGGACMLRGSGWARWLGMLWIGFHVVISIYHPWQQLAIHAVVFVIFAVALFHSTSNQYFRAALTKIT